MTTLQEIEAALPQLSAQELAQVEALIQSVRRERQEQTEDNPAMTSTPQAQRRIVKDSHGNGLWVMEALPGVLITSEMIRKIQDEDDEAEFQEHLARALPAGGNQAPKKEI